MAYHLGSLADRVMHTIRSRGQRDETGASVVEYALLVALIAVVCIVAVSLLGGNASNKFSQVGSALQ
jgi:pilus assembly protein Flp/PilA